MFGLASIQARLWAAAGVFLVAVLLALAGYGYGYGSGKEAGQAEAYELQLEQQRLLLSATEKNRELEKQHEQRVSDLREEFARLDADARSRDGRIIDDLRVGTRRLRLQVASCIAAAKPGEAGTAPGGADEAGTAELAPEAAAALWGIAGDGDSAIRQLTALQAWAASAMKACGTTGGTD